MKTSVCLLIVISCLLTTIDLISAEPAMPDSIVRVGACRPLGWPWGVVVKGNYAYVATRGYLSVVDVSIPSSPWVVTNFDNGFGPLGISLADTLAHINDGGRYSVVNVSDPGNPNTVGSCFVPVLTEPKGICTIQTNAYVAASDSGLQIVNASDPFNPFIVGRHHTPGRTRDLFVTGSLAYLADGDSLQIIDVSDSTAPFRVSAVAMPRLCYDVFVVDTLAYVACESSIGSNGTLQIVNVSDPGNPSIVNSASMSGDPWSVFVSDGYAYVAAADYWASSKDHERQVGGIRSESLGLRADVEGGLRVVDVSDPASPVLVASLDTPGDARDVFACSTLVFVADYESLLIFRHFSIGVEENCSRGQGTAEFELLQNQPNPFTSATRISYFLVSPTHVTLKVYSTAGQLVATLVDKDQGAGKHSVWLEADGMASGLYFCVLSDRVSGTCKKMCKVR